MAVTIQLPNDIENRLRAGSRDLDAEFTEAVVLELFRRGKLSHFEVAQIMKLDRFEVDAYLKRHGIYEGSLTMEDLEADRQTLNRVVAAQKHSKISWVNPFRAEEI